MRVLLVYPRFPRSYWGFQYTLSLTGKRASLPPLGLVSLAALLPGRWELRLVDLNVEPLRAADLEWADAVLVGGMLVQEPSIRDVVTRAHAHGKRVVVGGPGPTTSPDEFLDADHVFLGEAEGRAGEIVRAVEEPGQLPRILEAPRGRYPDLGLAPVPRFDLLSRKKYVSMAVQYSRGCPYTCEFCDIIEIYGRYPRVKSPEQMIAELEALHRCGHLGSVFVVDDNFIGNGPAVAKLLPRLRRWQAAHGFPFQLYTEASVNLASRPEIVRDMVAAGFTSVFLGIETPSGAALRETGKHQNVKHDLVRAVDVLTRAGLEVMGGFIVGFDSDGPGIFEDQREFISSVPVPLAMAGVLSALPGTALWRRLEKEGRLRGWFGGDQFDRPNFEPTMGEEALLTGYARLIEDIYEPSAYYRRCEAQIERAGIPSVRYAVKLDDVRTFLRAVWSLGVTSRRRGHFWKLLGSALRRSPRAIPRAIGHAIRGEHLIRYTRKDVLPRLHEAMAEVRAARTSEDGRSARTDAPFDVPVEALLARRHAPVAYATNR